MVPPHLAGYLETTAAERPGATAVVDAEGASLTYDELNCQADSLAAYLVDRGVGRGDRVGVALPKGIPALVSIFAAMKAGAAYVPVDAAAPAARGRRILEDCDVRALVVDARCLDMTPRSRLAAVVAAGPTPHDSTALAGTRRPLVATWDDALETGRAAGGAPAVSRDPADLAYVMYTSGSTGAPKGVMISHASAASFVDWCSGEFSPAGHDRFASHTPFHFDPSVFDVYVSVKHGAALHLVSEDLARNPADLARFIASRRLTVWCSTPSILRLLLQYGEPADLAASSLRLVLFGGEVFPVKYLRELTRRWPSAVFYNLYGPTETTTACTFFRIPSAVPDDRDTPYPIGVPCSHCRALVLDERGREVSAGDEGVLHISGASVFSGYWNRPDETAAACLDRDGLRWYNTGDVVRADSTEGFFFVGRRDRMVKRRGYRIELGEVESALLAHPAIREAAVVSVPDGRAGVRIIAVSAGADSARPSIVELKRFCATRIPAYMLPDEFVFDERLPRTSTGKLDYQAVLGRVAAHRALGAA